MFQTKTSDEDATAFVDGSDSDVLFSPSMSLCLLVAYTFVFCCCFFGEHIVYICRPTTAWELAVSAERNVILFIAPVI